LSYLDQCIVDWDEEDLKNPSAYSWEVVDDEGKVDISSVVREQAWSRGLLISVGRV